MTPGLQIQPLPLLQALQEEVGEGGVVRGVVRRRLRLGELRARANGRLLHGTPRVHLPFPGVLE